MAKQGDQLQLQDLLTVQENDLQGPFMALMAFLQTSYYSTEEPYKQINGVNERLKVGGQINQFLEGETFNLYAELVYGQIVSASNGAIWSLFNVIKYVVQIIGI